MDHGMIDPRDTRKVIGFCLSICQESRARKLKSNTFGIARMWVFDNLEKRFLISKLPLFINDVWSSLTPTTFFILIFFSSQKLNRSFIEHICKLGVLYQVFGKVLVTGILPKNKSLVLTFQYTKLGIEIITDFPILIRYLNTFSGL